MSEATWSRSGVIAAERRGPVELKGRGTDRRLRRPTPEKHSSGGLISGARTETEIPTPYPIEHDHRGVPMPRRPWTSEDSSSERGEGDHDAFAELARGAVTRLDRAARLILRDPELARDAVQEALIRAWRDLRGFA